MKSRRRCKFACLIPLLIAVAGTALAAKMEKQIRKGKYLTRIGNCAGCHTAPGGAEFAGGHAIESDYGTFYVPNITPDRATGIGNWNADDFWAALHEGERQDGSALYPACPYPSYTNIRREDVDAIYAYLQSMPAHRNETREHRLDFPFSARSLIPAWQALFFEPGEFEADKQRNTLWNRGAYLVNGLGHCSACHTDRNAFGVTRVDTSAPGEQVRGWYAPSLHASNEAGLQHRSTEDAATLLRTGKSGNASTMGPMADVVFDSLQYLSRKDARAMANYLRSLPDKDVEPSARLIRLSKSDVRAAMESGKSVYDERCRDCHGDDGGGSVTAPALAGNRAVTASNPTNLANVIRHGGFPPSTEWNPRPWGMPPSHDLTDQEVAAVISYIRASWGNEAPPIPAANLP